MGAPFVLTNGGFVDMSVEAAMVTDVETQARTTGDGRRWTLRPARPTDARGLARAVR